jgi:hypothetical protein
MNIILNFNVTALFFPYNVNTAIILYNCKVKKGINSFILQK